MTAFLEPMDLRFEDPRVWPKLSVNERVIHLVRRRFQDTEVRDEILAMLGLTTITTSREIHNDGHGHRRVLHTFTCTVCGRERLGAKTGICKYCQGTQTRGRVNHQVGG